MRLRPGLLALLAVMVALGPGPAAGAEAWPQRPVRIVVPFPPGGNTDGIARIIAQRLGDALGQPFVVENRAGASGAIAAEAVARAPADGYMLFMGSPSQIAILPAMTKVAYDPVKDFVPISNIGTNPFVLVVNANLPAKTVAEFVAYVAAQPNPLAYAATALGSPSHLSMALFLKRAGLTMTPVLYKGAAPALNDVIAGHVPTYFANFSEALPHADGTALRLLAVTGSQRAPQLPDVPTLSESGFPGFKTLTWNGLLAPAGTPREIVERIAQEVAAATRDAKFVDRLAGYGVDPLGNSPEEFAAMIATDLALWAEAVKIAGVQEK
jgi:tripartite-type tricarboxylate transporter receptor subunit TctC